MNQVYSVVIGLVLIIGIGGLVYWQKQESLETVPATAMQETGAASQPTSSTGFERENEDEEENEIEFEDGTVAETPTSGAGTSGSTGASGGITAAVVAQHSTRASCWASINGNVYDLTSWIPKHPGGEQAILQLCGKDGSAKFNGQHKGGAPVQTLAGFKIGVLAQ